MKTEDLINKYIDGELENDENDELRRRSNEDPLVKDDVNQAVLINSFIKKDAESIELPNKLKKNVKAQIDRRFIEEEKLLTYHSSKPAYYFAAAVVAVFIFGFAIIGEFPMIEYYSNMAKLNSTQVLHDTIYNVVKVKVPVEVADKATAAETTDAESSLSNEQAEVDREKAESDAENSNNAFSESESGTVIYSLENIKLLAEPEVEQLQSVVAVADTLTPAVLERRIHTTRYVGFAYAGNQEGGLRNRSKSLRNAFVGIPTSDNQRMLTDVAGSVSDKNFEFVTSYGGYSNSNVFSSGDDKFSIGLSQSAGYRLSRRNKIGFEFGYMNFDYSEKNSKTIMGDVQQDGSGAIGVKPSPVITVEVRNSISDRSLFGTLYYEYRILESRSFSIDAHSGLGLSRDGFININRLSASYKIFNGVKLTAGLDGRFFNASFPDSDTKARKFCTAMSLLYGLQIDL